MKKTYLIRSLLLVLLLPLVLFISGCSNTSDSGSDADTSGSSSSAAFTHLEPEDAKAMIEAGDCILVDTRGEPQYDYEHIPGAINVPVDAEDADIEEALPDKDAKILLYCDYGGLSKQMGDHMALDLGYSNLYEFDGLLVWDGPIEGESVE